MAFSLFGKKDPAAPRAGKDSSAGGDRRSGMIPDAFRAPEEAPGRFGHRLARRANDPAGTVGYEYGPEVSGNSIEDLSTREPSLPPWQAAAGEGEPQAPASEAAFTHVPSSLDVGTSPRREPALSGRDIPEAIEDAALSFATGQVAEALKTIETAIAEENLGRFALQAWFLRFDLYEHLGLKAAFETQALRFATLFERSPPVWDAAVPAPVEAPAPATPTVNITGALSAASAGPLSALRKTVERYQGVRLDFARLLSADKDGCRFLLVTLQSLRRAGKQVLLSNENVLIDLLRPSVRAGERGTDAAVWLLFMEALQLAGDKLEFERVAIDYATTFEVSPPSWQLAPRPVVVQPPPVALEERFYLEGDVVAPADEMLARLERYAAGHPVLVIDMGRLGRIDFVCASQLTSTLARLHQAGQSIELRSPNEMVAALLALMGTAESARIVPRRR